MVLIISGVHCRGKSFFSKMWGLVIVICLDPGSAFLINLVAARDGCVITNEEFSCVFNNFSDANFCFFGQ